MSRYIPKFLKEFYDDYQNVKLQLQETNFAMQILRQKCEESRSQCNNAYTDIQSEYELARQHNRELQRTVDILREEVGILNQENDEIRGNLAAISQRLDSAAAVTDRVSRSEDRLTVLTKSEESMTRQLEEMHEKYLQVQTDARIMRDNLVETRENVIADTSRAVANLEEELDVLRDRFEFDTPLRRLDYYIDCLEKGKELKTIFLKQNVMSSGSHPPTIALERHGYFSEKLNRFYELLQTNQTVETFYINGIGNVSFYWNKFSSFVCQSRKLKNLYLLGQDGSIYSNDVFESQSLVNIYISLGIPSNRHFIEFVNRNNTIKSLEVSFFYDCQNAQMQQLKTQLTTELQQICNRKGIQQTVNY